MSAGSPRPPLRRTRRSVLIIDRVSGIIIRGGGLLVLVAVLGICVFLFAVFLPLFGSARVEPQSRFRLPRGAKDLLFAEIDEYRVLGLGFYRDGVLSVFDARTGASIREERFLPEGSVVRSASRHAPSGLIAFGKSDGGLYLGRLGFESSFLESLPEGTSLPEGAAAIAHDGGLIERTSFGRIRQTSVQLTVEEVEDWNGGEIVLLDHRARQGDEMLAALEQNGRITVSRVARTKTLLDNAGKASLETFELPTREPPRGATPARILVSAQGDQLYLGWSDGTLQRFNVRSPEQPIFAEAVDATDGEARLTGLRFMSGDQSIVTGDSSGACKGWYRIHAGKEESLDGYRLVKARDFEEHADPLREIAVSSRDKTFATGTYRGDVWVRHMTSSRVLARITKNHHSVEAVAAEGGSSPVLAAEREGANVIEVAPPVASLQIAPKSDAIFVVHADGSAAVHGLENPHPEATPGTIFGKVWYEGHDAPTYTWQSSGSDDFESKLSLVPLIYGTLKATCYALLFAVPVALLAAIYTSEFLSRRARALVKPGIEMMASLPSVVLGFLAALVLAPWIEDWVVSIILVFFVAPLAMVLAAYAWLLLPHGFAMRLEGYPKLILTALAFVLAVAAAFPAGRLIESWFFLGDFRAWLSPPWQGTGTALWAGLFFPLILLLALIVRARRRRVRAIQERAASGPRSEALAQLGMGCVFLVGVLAASVALALLMTAAGFDPRHSVVGTYVQRNTLIVGFAMGFAVIPIIYTIAEDALSAVPEHLRGAALGCGATPWQTATMVILPTAMSGIFAAVMVGLGRAVGETMIVVMAAGNTPIMDPNPFNGLRALSATIAVELPEAVKDGTLYRMLFLAAGTLFVMTFIVNTVAEVIRIRFRRRAFEL